MRADLDRLPPMPKMVDRIDVAERFAHLEIIVMHARSPRATAASVARWAEFLKKNGYSAERRAATKLAMESLGDVTTDWNLILRMGNARCDRYADAFRKPAGIGRRKAVKAIDENIATMLKTADDKAASEPSPDHVREARARRLESAYFLVYATAVPTHLDVDDRTTTRCELTKLAFALAAYCADQGSYPEKLAELVPKHLNRLPKDVFNNDAELCYARKGDGYLLYSVGRNGKDDGGRGQDDRKNNEDWDDLAVRMSAATH